MISAGDDRYQDISWGMSPQEVRMIMNAQAYGCEGECVLDGKTTNKYYVYKLI